MVDKNRTCAFTGHRMEKLPWRDNESDPRCVDLKNRIYDAVRTAYQSGITHFICGMATGCDMYFCEAAIALREEKPDVTIEAAIPFDGQSKSWDEALRRRHSRLVEDCDYLTVVQHEFSPNCFTRRNRYMVDNSCLLIAAYNGRPGGTMNTLVYALRQGLDIVELGIGN